MSHSVRIRPPAGPVQGTVLLRGSKSITNRLLIMQAVAGTNVQLDNFPAAGDSVLLRQLLENLPSTVDARDAGTVFRFLTALLAVREGEYLLTGTARMCQRPIGDLVDALRALGADIAYAGREGFPPLRIRGRKLHGGAITINTRISSQFASALLLIAPAMPRGLALTLTQPPVSAPYLQMTIRLMQQFGVPVHQDGLRIVVPPQSYHMQNFFIEPDWSSASYLYEIAALSTESEIALPGLQENSLQGDAAVAAFMQPLGVSTQYRPDGIRISRTPRDGRQNLQYHLNDFPDLAPALFAIAAALSQPADFTGLHHLAYKESDRMEAFARELRRCNIMLTKHNETVQLRGTFQASSPHFDTYNDHRLAMALAPLCLQCGEVIVRHPEVVSKSYPNYWDDLAALGFSVEPC